MKQIKLLNWVVEVDVDKTREFYRSEQELCDCLYCENYVEACKRLDFWVLDVFTTLGIDALKPIHLSELGEIEGGLRLYHGCYHVVGKLIEGEYCSNVEWNDANTAEVGTFRIGFGKGVLFADNHFPQSVLQLEFEARIQWILLEQPED